VLINQGMITWFILVCCCVNGVIMFFRQVRLYITLLYLHSCGPSFCILLMIYLQLATLVLPKLRPVYSDISTGLAYPMMWNFLSYVRCLSTSRQDYFAICCAATFIACSVRTVLSNCNWYYRPLPQCKDSGSWFIFTVLDLCTHYPETIPLTRHTAQNVAKALGTVFTRFGFPQKILSDQGSNIMSKLMQLFLSEFKINQIRNSTSIRKTTQQSRKRHLVCLSLIEHLVCTSDQCLSLCTPPPVLCNFCSLCQILTKNCYDGTWNYRNTISPLNIVLAKIIFCLIYLVALSKNVSAWAVHIFLYGGGCVMCSTLVKSSSHYLL